MKHLRGQLDGVVTTGALDQPARGGALGSVAVRDVTKTYQSRGTTIAALSSVTFDVGAGELIAVVGQSGCGKSTLLRTIAGLTRPTTGSILIDGREHSGAPPSVRYVFQDYASSLFPWKTVDANLCFGLSHPAFGAPPPEDIGSECQRLLSRIGLPEIGQRYPWELSGGMQQRVAIARAIAAQPKTILLDEAFSSVDAISRAKLQDMTRALWRQLGMTVMFVTHDIDEAVYLANRILVLGPGGQGIVADIRSALPPDRSQIETRESAEFLALRRELNYLILA
jgi:NitT/TauT family transport system ATP-binding protein